MKAPDQHDAERLAAIHAYWRKRFGRFWLAATVFIAIGFLAGWLWTNDRGYLYSAFFFPLIPLSGYIYCNFYLLNPHRDPNATQRKIEQLERQQQRNARTVAKVNGMMLLIASPFLLFIAVGTGFESLGWPGAVLGLVGVGVGFVAIPLAMISWARRTPPG